MPPTGFEFVILASERPQTHALDLNKYETLSAQGVRNIRNLSSEIPYLEADGN
jgi:hypothetical protein